MSKNNSNPYIDYDGTNYWYNARGSKHRVGEPAVIYTTGQKEWWINGQRHNIDGPAVIYANGRKAWWIEDKKYLKTDFDREVAKKRPQDISNRSGRIPSRGKASKPLIHKFDDRPFVTSIQMISENEYSWEVYVDNRNAGKCPHWTYVDKHYVSGFCNTISKANESVNAEIAKLQEKLLKQLKRDGSSQIKQKNDYINEYIDEIVEIKADAARYGVDLRNL